MAATIAVGAGQSNKSDAARVGGAQMCPSAALRAATGRGGRTTTMDNPCGAPLPDRAEGPGPRRAERGHHGHPAHGDHRRRAGWPRTTATRRRGRSPATPPTAARRSVGRGCRRTSDVVIPSRHCELARCATSPNRRRPVSDERWSSRWRLRRAPRSSRPHDGRRHHHAIGFTPGDTTTGTSPCGTVAVLATGRRGECSATRRAARRG